MPKWSATGVTGVRFESTLAAREIILNRDKKDFYLTVLYVTFCFSLVLKLIHPGTWSQCMAFRD